MDSVACIELYIDILEAYISNADKPETFEYINQWLLFYLRQSSVELAIIALIEAQFNASAVHLQ